MALLHRLRDAGDHGGVKRRFAVFLVALSALAGCKQEANPHPPDPMLQDSLGLTAEDRVYRVALRNQSGAELVEPAETMLEPGSYVEFLSSDRQVRVISFPLDEMDPRQAEFLRSTGQDRSPPLIELDSRFVVSFEGAPLGRYPFVVEGSGAPAHGTVRVENARR